MSTTGALALDVLRTQANRFLALAPSARCGEDPEDVHQMRVATRRLRAALRLFHDVLPPESAGVGDELKWVAGQLGAVRDLDVQLQHLEHVGEELGASAGLAPYGAWLGTRRKCARSSLLESFETPRYTDLVRCLGQVMTAWTPVDAPLGTDGPRRLRRVYKQLRKRADPLDDAPATAALHQVRIRAKRVRYAVEFFLPVYGKAAGRFVESVVALQDLLGELQDGVVSTQLVREAVSTEAVSWPAATSLALGQLVQRDAQRAFAISRSFPEVYQPLRGKAWDRLTQAMRLPLPSRS